MFQHLCNRAPHSHRSYPGKNNKPYSHLISMVINLWAETVLLDSFQPASFKLRTLRGLLCHGVCPPSMRQKEDVIWWVQLVWWNSRASLLFCLYRGNYSALTQWKSQHPVFVPPTHSSRMRDKRSVSIVLSRCSSPTGKWDTVLRVSCKTFIRRAENQWGGGNRSRGRDKAEKLRVRGALEDATGTGWSRICRSWAPDRPLTDGVNQVTGLQRVSSTAGFLATLEIRN